jgi:hypothetical protein
MNGTISHDDSSPRHLEGARGSARTARECGISTLHTVRTFWSFGTCSESTMHVIDRAFGSSLELEEHGSRTLAGGIAQHGYQCGMLWGAALAAGAEAHRIHGAGACAEAAALHASQRLVASFMLRTGTTECFEITDIDWRVATKSPGKMALYFLKGGPIACMRLSASFAVDAFEAISAALADERDERAAPACSPVSCAAELVKQAGLSDLHAAMAAGFAGGIGLSGSGCGALGAAIWAAGMEHAARGLDYGAMNARAAELIERFLKRAGYELECSEIVGRTFADADDHALYLAGGGCSSLIEDLALATKEARHA